MRRRKWYPKSPALVTRDTGTSRGYYQPNPKTVMILTRGHLPLFLKTFVKFFKHAEVQTGSVNAHDPSINTLWRAVKILAGFHSHPHFSWFFLRILKQISDCISFYLHYFRLHFWKLQKLSFHKHGPLSLLNPILEITVIPKDLIIKFPGLSQRCLLWSRVWSAVQCSVVSDRMDCRPPGSSVHGTFQARILEWVATPYSRGSS